MNAQENTPTSATPSSTSAQGAPQSNPPHGNIDALIGTAQAVRQKMTGAGAPFELETISVERHGKTQHYTAFKNAARTLPDMLDMGRAHADSEFLICGEQRLTYADFYADVDAAAGYLYHQLGLQKGSRGMVCAVNSPQWAQAFAAIAYTGAIVAPGNSYSKHDALLYAMHLIQPHVLLCDRKVFARIAQDIQPDGSLHINADAGPSPASKESKPAEPAIIPHIIVLDATADDALPAGVLRWTDIIAAGKQRGLSVPADIREAQDTDEPALILSTSGTTGRAKGAVSSHRAVCQALSCLDYMGTMSAATSPERIAALMQRPQVRLTTLNLVPFFHVSGLHVQLLATLRGGRTLVIMSKWNADRALDIIQKEQITQLNCAPSMLQQLFDSPRFADDATLKTLAGVGLGGAASAPHLVDTLAKKLPHGLIGTGYGLTETNGMGASAGGDLYLAKEGHSGIPVPIVETRVVEESGNVQTDGEPGEVQMRGVTLMHGYWRNSDATADALSDDGWFSTGDVGYMDAHGFIYIIDRIKDVIIRYGENISANWVESEITSHPAVVEAAVVGLPCAHGGEQVATLVRLQPNRTLTAQELQTYLADRVADYKIPTVVQFTTEPLPRNATSKLLKKEIKNLLN